MSSQGGTRQKLLQTAIDLIWEHNYGSVSVDDICRRAGLLKGSFYHFFPSKADLAAAAIAEHWVQRREKLTAIFSASAPAIERLSRYCESVYEIQRAQQERVGKVCGCPLASIGSEQSTEDEKIRGQTQRVFEGYIGYFAATLRDAAREGAIPGGEKLDAEGLARELFSFLLGTLLQAKVENDLGIVRCLRPALFRLIGAREPAAAV